MKVKKRLECKSAFLFLLANHLNEPVITPGFAHQMVTKDIIYKALMIQSILKASRPNIFNFEFYICVIDSTQ